MENKSVKAKRKEPFQTLNDQHKSNLNKILDQKTNFSAQGKLGEFFDLYIVCEVTARKLIYYNTHKKDIKFRIDDLEKAVNKFYPEKYDKDLIQQIFKSGKGKRGNKTSRELRNSYLHTLCKDDRQEIENRFDTLKMYMNRWIEIFNE